MNYQNPVTHFMTIDVITVGKTDSCKTAKDLMDENKIHHLLVVDEDEKLAGIISYGDIIYLLKSQDNDGFESYRNEMRLKMYKVNEVMSSKLITLQYNDVILTALQIYHQYKFNALPVLKDGEIAGILTVFDIIKYLVKDAETLTT